MSADIFYKKKHQFLLWLPSYQEDSPTLIIGCLKMGAPVEFINERRFDLLKTAGFTDLWSIQAEDCDLQENQVYHYWFEVNDTNPKRSGQRIRITDPLAYTVDWRLLAPEPPGEEYGDDDRYPSAVVKYNGKALIPCDAGGEGFEDEKSLKIESLPANNKIVIYELPTAWMQIGSAGEREIGVGSFRDTTALIENDREGANFHDLGITKKGRSYLTELGINALELLPPADSFYYRQWGYGTTNFLAPDFELGFPQDYSWPTPNRDLQLLVKACHAHSIRFFIDVVMAFAKNNAYLAAGTNEFFILEPKVTPQDPDAHNSRGQDADNFRNGYGSSLFRYSQQVQGYDPISGDIKNIYPARQLMKISLLHWMEKFQIDGIRMDSVENVANWHFIEEYKNLARANWKNKWGNQKETNMVEERFLVVGEELSEPLDLIRQGRLDGLWHENFKKYIRAALLGQNVEGETSFEWTVRKAIDCRLFGYSDMSQAIIYLTSHDVEGFRNERLFNFFQNNQIHFVERRIKLGFVCLMTAVGIPMILAGEEFADQHDLFDRKGQVSQAGGKQVDPVNFSRIEDEWRIRIRDYVARLIKLRTRHEALAVNDTKFIHADFDEGKRVLAWRRGYENSESQVVVVANFSDFQTENSFQPEAEYRVPNWPSIPPKKKWREMTQERDVSLEWAGREPIYPWEAKVYATVEE